MYSFPFYVAIFLNIRKFQDSNRYLIFREKKNLKAFIHFCAYKNLENGDTIAIFIFYQYQNRMYKIVHLQVDVI